MRSLYLSILILLSLLAYCPRSSSAQSAAAPIPSTTIAADLGPCSALITVTGTDSRPVYGAKMNARIQYGFMGVKKLDLEAYSGSDGIIRITNLPESLKKPVYIHISKGELGEMVVFNPNVRCHATFNVQLAP